MDAIAELILTWMPIIITVASVITAATPTPKDDGVLASVYKVIEALALVVGRAKEKGDGA